MAKAPAEAQKVEGKPEQKQEHKPEQKHEPKQGGSKAKGHTPAPGGCFSWGCKKEAHRFNFCDEHYEHFKFGLIKKTGEPVPDHEKKLGHFLAHQAKKGAHKVA